MSTISEKLVQLGNIKSDIKTAIINKGGSATDDFTTYAELITNLPSGGETEELTINQNGTYEAPEGKAYSKVTAACPLGTGDMFGFDTIGYTADTGTILEDVAHSKTLYDAWNPARTSAYKLYENDTKLVYAPFIDTKNVTDMYHMFSYCPHLTTVPLLDTHNVTDMNYMFYYCSNLTTVPQLDTSSVTNMGSMLYNCSKLTTIPLLDTSNVTDMHSMFYNCSSLTTIPLLDTSNVTNVSSMFSGCSKLTTIPLLDTSSVTNVSSMFGYCSSLTDLGGLKDIGKAFTGSSSSSHNFSLSNSSKLTHDALMNVINNLYDMTTTTVTDAKLTLSSTPKGLLTDDEKAIVTTKGWTLA